MVSVIVDSVVTVVVGIKIVVLDFCIIADFTASVVSLIAVIFMLAIVGAVDVASVVINFGFIVLGADGNVRVAFSKVVGGGGGID